MIAAMLVLTACGSMPAPLQTLQQAVGLAPASAASAPVLQAATPVKTSDLPPVDPAAQRAFDAARQALTAGRIDEAERGFTALAKQHPELGGAHANLGLVHRRAGRRAEAVAALEQAVRASPAQPVFHNQLGIAYREHGAFEQARAAYERAIELDAGYAAPILNLGILHDLYLEGGSARALELYDRYLVVAPGPDATVSKWVADLKNRKPVSQLVKKETP